MAVVRWGWRAESGGLSEQTLLAARQVLEGRRRGLGALLPFAGPAFVASVAYMDPGNFATNIQGGALYGYRLLWVVVFANVAAMLFQALSAKLGIATNKNLAELCREQFFRPAAYGMWVVSEVAAMATDLAEFLGASLAFNLLFHIPLLVGALFTAVATFGVLMLQSRGFRPLEVVIGALVGVIAGCYLIETFWARPDWGGVLAGSSVPWLGDKRAVLLAVGVVGATVMPHAIYLHSGLTQNRILATNASERRRVVRLSNLDCVVALSLAGLVNVAMMYMAAATFHPHHSEVADIQSAYRTLVPLLGGASALVFAVSLLAAGLSSSAVGTVAGQMIMQGFVGFTIPLWLRRLLTMAPAIAVIAWGVNLTQALVLSQVVLSLALPVPVIALLVLTSRRSVMGELCNRRITSWVASGAAAIIVVLNMVLLVQTVRPA